MSAAQKLQRRHSSKAGLQNIQFIDATRTSVKQESWLEVGKKSLFLAVRNSDVDRFQYCLNNGCSVESMDDHTGDTPLILACRLGMASIVECALRWKAENDPHPGYGQTALQAAVSAGKIKCLNIMLEIATLSNTDTTIVNHIYESKETPIHVASRCGSLEILELLTNHGANIQSLDAHERTCIHCAAQGGHTDCLAYLLDIGADTLIEDRDSTGHTCLHLAVKANNIDCVRLLLESAADVNAKTLGGFTSYQISVACHMCAMERTILEYTNIEVIVENLDKFRSDPRERKNEDSLPRPYSKVINESRDRLQSQLLIEKQSSNIFSSLDTFTVSAEERPGMKKMEGRLINEELLMSDYSIKSNFEDNLSAPEPAQRNVNNKLVPQRLVGSSDIQPQVIEKHNLISTKMIGENSLHADDQHFQI